MRVGAALSVMNLIVGLATLGSVRDNISRQLKDSGNYTKSNADAAYTLWIVYVVLVGVLAIGLWLWMARANGNGKRWARSVATALGALSILGSVLSLSEGGSSTIGAVLAAVTALLAGVILVLLWRKESTEYYRARSRPTYS